MSWSVSVIGTPEAITRELDIYQVSLQGQSREEFDDAKPHIQALLKQNRSIYHPPLLHLEACGSGGKVNNQETGRECTITLRRMWTKVVT